MFVHGKPAEALSSIIGLVLDLELRGKVIEILWSSDVCTGNFAILICMIHQRKGKLSHGGGGNVIAYIYMKAIQLMLPTFVCAVVFKYIMLISPLAYNILRESNLIILPSQPQIVSF